MRRTNRIVFIVVLALAMPVLAGCSNFDPDSLDIFGLNEKKKLPGERRAVFPEGVPGVSQGIPPEYLKGNQSAADAAAVSLPPEPEKPVAAKKTAAVEPQKPKRKPKPRAPVAQQAPAQQPAPAAQQQQPWPDQPQAAPPAQSSSTAPWPNQAPPPNTFSR